MIHKLWRYVVPFAIYVWVARRYSMRVAIPRGMDHEGYVAGFEEYAMPDNDILVKIHAE